MNRNAALLRKKHKGRPKSCLQRETDVQNNRNKEKELCMGFLYFICYNKIDQMLYCDLRRLL